MHPLKRYRLRHNLTTHQFAERANIPQPSIWRWENYKAIPRPDKARQASQATNQEVTEYELYHPKEYDEEF
jgi:transcriptional regulator with XRE-family HTH domain